MVDQCEYLRGAFWTAKRVASDDDITPPKLRRFRDRPSFNSWELSKVMRQLPSIPPAFAARKTAILTSLGLPSSDYRDLSPKGSVDEAIVPLIEKINALEGVVTTSSCSGRVSVFLEGNKSKGTLCNGGDAVSHGGQESRSEQVAVPGGKGRGGRWLFVSHKPVDVAPAVENGCRIMNILGLTRNNKQSGNCPGNGVNRLGRRLVRFQFEPMVCNHSSISSLIWSPTVSAFSGLTEIQILHIMTASLAHASSVLAAAINAGFRESGVQSLKNLDDPLNAFPMVAVRTSGLAFESLIGYAVEDTHIDEAKGDIHSLVSEDYLGMLLEVANERFQANKQRMHRFEMGLFRTEQSKPTEWETHQSRQARKRADGLARRHALKSESRGERVEKIAPEEDDADDNLKQNNDNLGLLTV